MKYFELELNEKIYKLRLTGSNAIGLEKALNGKSVLDIVQNYSMTSIITVLEYMGKNEDNKNQFSLKEASSLYDLLVDNGYTMYDIVFKIIYEVLVISGFLSKEELEDMMNTNKKLKEVAKQEVSKIS